MCNTHACECVSTHARENYDVTTGKMNLLELPLGYTLSYTRA
jgi:hypothetical protein